MVSAVLPEEAILISCSNSSSTSFLLYPVNYISKMFLNSNFNMDTSKSELKQVNSGRGGREYYSELPNRSLLSFICCFLRKAHFPALCFISL